MNILLRARQLLAILVMSGTLPLAAAPGDIDPSFNATLGARGSISAILVQPDGKCVVTSDRAPWVYRLQPDGTTDETFVPDQLPLSRISAISLARDGKLLVQGVFTNDNLTHGLGRLNPNGTPDTSFVPAPPYHGKIECFAALSDGRVLLTRVEFEAPEIVAGIARLNEDGSLDGTVRLKVGFMAE